MSYIDIAFIAIAVLMVIAGACRGLVVSLLHMLKFLIGIPLSFFLSDLLYLDIYNSFIKNAVYDSVLNELNDSESAENLLEGINNFVSELPDYLAKNIDLSNLSTLTAEQISSNITDNVLEPIVLIVLKIVIFIVSLVVFCIIVSILISAFSKLQKKDHMPLKHTNSLLGGLFGFIKAVMLIFTISVIISTVCSILPQDNSFVRQADSSYALEFINTYNPLSEISDGGLL